ncbi:7064_t:CDS:1, partial [Cetraspora pellucida]
TLQTRNFALRKRNIYFLKESNNIREKVTSYEERATSRNEK